MTTWKKQLREMFAKTGLTKDEIENIINGLVFAVPKERSAFIIYLKKNKAEILPKLSRNLSSRRRAIKSGNIRLVRKYLEEDKNGLKSVDLAIKEAEDEIKISKLRKEIASK